MREIEELEQAIRFKESMIDLIDDVLQDKNNCIPERFLLAKREVLESEKNELQIRQASLEISTGSVLLC